MKKRMIYFWPLLFALFSLVFYILIYRPWPWPAGSGSGDFITGLLVFFAAMGWSAIILLTGKKNQTVYYIYISILVVFPLFIVLVFQNADIPWHLTIIGLTLIAAVGVRIFVSGHLKRRKE